MSRDVSAACEKACGALVDYLRFACALAAPNDVP
jgi:hypothetical protein